MFTYYRNKLCILFLLIELPPRTWMDSLERPEQNKTDVRFGAWNVGSLYWTASLKKDKSIRAFSTHGREDECIQGSGGKNQKERD
jgi:hypothetical protein